MYVWRVLYSNHTRKRRNVILQLAINNGNLVLVALLCSKLPHLASASVNAETGATSFYIACQSGNVSVVSLLAFLMPHLISVPNHVGGDSVHYCVFPQSRESDRLLLSTSRRVDVVVVVSCVSFGQA